MLARTLFFAVTLSQVSAADSEWVRTLPPEEYAIFSLCALALVCFGGLMSGLNVGMLSLDELELEQKISTGTEEEKRMARRVLPVISDHHWLLVSILLGNAAAGEALPVVLNMMFNEVLSIVFSVTFVLFCGEIIPQAVMTGPDQLKIASRLVPFVRGVMYLFFPISYPVAMLLDKCLGESPSTAFTSDDLRNLLVLHQHTYEKRQSLSEDKGLSEEQLQMINGAIDLRKQLVSDVMIPIDEVFSISNELLLDDQTLVMIREKGFSRIPVYKGSDPADIYAVFLSKKLIGYDSPTQQRLSETSFKLRQPMYVKPDLSMLKLLQMFQGGTDHMAFVTFHPPSDTLSLHEIMHLSTSVLGVITMEDVLQKLIDSKIYDESDMERLRAVSVYQESRYSVEPLRISRRVMAGKTPIVRHVRIKSYYRAEDSSR
jgi:CBS domain containing-hemolysin-like protein